MAEEREKDEQGRYKVLTPYEYQTSVVDFYGQTLGSTGIDVRDEEEEEDKREETYVAPNIMGDNESEPSNVLSQGLGITGKGTNEFDNFENLTDNVSTFNTSQSYNDYLSGKGTNKSDLSAIEKSIDNKLGGIAQKVNNKVKDFGIAFAKPTAESTQKQGIAQIGAKLMGANPMLSAIAGGMFSLDDSYKDPTGQTSARPGGALGLAYDLNMSNQYSNFASIEAAQQASENDAAFEGDAFTQGDKGFAARINGQLVSRGVGKSYYDGVYDLSTEQLKNMEALQRGYSTSGFDPRNPDAGSRLAGSGKVGYDNAGRFHSINGVSAYGKEQDAINLGKEYGLSLAEVQGILSDVRGRTGMFSSVPTGKNLTQMLEDKQKEKQEIEEAKRAEEARKAKLAREIAEKQRKAAEERRKEEQRQNEELDRIEQEAREQAERERQYRDEFNYGDNDGGGGNDGTDGGYGGADNTTDYGGTAMGGRIGMKEGGNTAETEVVQPAGFIQRDPNATKQQEIADDIPFDAKRGDFVINAPAAKQAGKQDIQRMISTAITNLQEKGVDVRFGNPKINIADNVKLLVSRNEVYIPKIIAEEIGYDRLDKMNNRGKREVARRQQQAEQAGQAEQGMNEGGFIKKNEKNDEIESADYSEGGIDASRAMILRLTGHLKNIEEGLGEGFKYGKKSKAGDTLRHILTSGYISEDGFFNKFMSDAFDSREKSNNMSEEDKIDLNNNKFGRLLRQKYPDRMEFTKQARQVVKNLLKGKKTEIDGVSPMLSVRAEQHL